MFVMLVFRVNCFFASAQDDVEIDIVAKHISSLGFSTASLVVEETVPAIPEGVVVVDFKTTLIIPSRLELEPLLQDIAGQIVVDPQMSADRICTIGFFNGLGEMHTAIYDNAVVILKNELPLLEKSIMEKGITIGMERCEDFIRDCSHIIPKEQAARQFEVEMETNIPQLNSLDGSKIRTKVSGIVLVEESQKNPVKAFQNGFFYGAHHKERVMNEHAFILDKDEKSAYNNVQYNKGMHDAQVINKLNKALFELRIKYSHRIAEQQMRRVFEEDKIRERNKNLRNGFVIGATVGGIVVGTAAYFYAKKG
jgi:hypothetical protein